jgi:sulfatase modifying factor 1
MSAAVETYRDDLEATYAVDFSRESEPSKKRARFPEYRRRGSAPSRVSGMHCRRNKRWTWGSGRGARLLNTRAFAGALAFAVASVASSVLGVTLDMVTIGNPGNAANSFGYGAVPYVFEMARFETTNSEYVAFLNSVGSTNPNGIYDSRMGSTGNGGIEQSGSPGSFTYSVRPGTNAMGASYADMPVIFTTWFSAARFANWLHNGQSSDPNLLETGSYTLNNAISGPIVSRNPNATFVLPTVDEWMKAGFHTGGLTSADYVNWATNSNTKPDINTATPSTANTANYGGAAGGTTGPLAVGSYTNSLSPYGLFEMQGNVAEMTETANPDNANQWTAMSGSWGTANASLSNFAGNLGFAPTYVGGTAGTAQIGFRIAAVPEPSTYALLAAGAAGLGSLQWVKRRRRNVA